MMSIQTPEELDRRFCVAPMMDWTDRHCRFLHRLLSSRAVLFTEMISDNAILHGDRKRLLDYNAKEHPVVLQLGGADPQKMAQAAKIAEEWGYDEINLNCGCPSDRVQSGQFGAALMNSPARVAEIIDALKSASRKPVSVKCRLGVDEQDCEESLDQFVSCVAHAGVSTLYVHARKAWLNGLNPKANRSVPPLDYGRVRRLKRRFNHLSIVINGGIETLADARVLLKGPAALDGVMMGRAAYQRPMILLEVDRAIYENPGMLPNLSEIFDKFADYAGAQMARGVPLSAITRHMLGLGHGSRGARRFRRMLTEDARSPGASPSQIVEAGKLLTSSFERKLEDDRTVVPSQREEQTMTI